jgi:hypothetical protein
MLRIYELPLETPTILALQAFQDLVDVIPMDDNWKKKLDDLWSEKTKTDAFQDVKVKLSAMCPGAMRCCYCEDSAAAGIEHIHPKVFYPKLTFVWENYLYICANCNSRKGATWAIFLTRNGARQSFKVPGKKKGQPRTFPPSGDPVLINPRVENPADFLHLVIDPKFDKFDFLESINGRTCEEIQRAIFTKATLKLNSGDRPELATARKEAYDNYKGRLTRYVRRRNEGWSDSDLQNIVVQLKKMAHPTVWFEIKRCQTQGKLINVDPEFSELFTEAPEALTW